MLVAFVNPCSPKSAGVQSIKKETFGSKDKAEIMCERSLAHVLELCAS